MRRTQTGIVTQTLTVGWRDIQNFGHSPEMSTKRIHTSVPLKHYSPYWKRTWTFQEITLPADTLLIHGSTLIRLSSLETLTEWMLGFLSREASDFSFLDRGAYQDLLMAVQFVTNSFSFSIKSALTTREQLATQERPTLTLVPPLAELHASDPRDKIFGLLGVMDTQLVADYNKHFTQVYCEFVSAWLLEVRNLNFLFDACRIRNRDVQHGLPSWAPDWDSISQALNTDEEMVDIYPMGQFLHDRDHQASARLLTDPAHLNQSSRILTATGVVCDEVEELYPGWRGSKGSLAISTSFFDLVQRHIDRSMLGGNCSRRHVFQALFRTAFHDSCPGGSLGNSSPRLLQSDATKVHTWGICFLLYLALRYTASGDPSAPDPDGFATTLFPRLGIPYGQDFSRFWREEIFGDMKLEEPDVPHWPHAPAALRWVMEDHMAEFHSIRLHSTTPLETNVKFLTKNNDMGFASSAGVGDKVVVLGGCDAPVLLRPKDDHYEHISACVVVGLMDGEAKEMVDRGEAKLETFEIH
ncbi:HET domain-containing protein [Fusarium sp. LHS14.1]|nr:HET domain-containing protein [Fusarium sp. LHS14.1]